MILKSDSEHQKEAAINMFREILNTPYMLEIDFHYCGRVHEPMTIEYQVKRAVVAESED